MKSEAKTIEQSLSEIPEDRRKARKWFRKSAEQGNQDNQWVQHSQWPFIE